jgi:hypothetical protein
MLVSCALKERNNVLRIGEKCGREAEARAPNGETSIRDFIALNELWTHGGALENRGTRSE